MRVTIADISKAQDGSHRREAYLSVVLADGEADSVEEAETIDGGDNGVGVDAGAVGFVDHEAVDTAMPADGADWYDGLFDSGEPGSWFELMDSAEHYRAGAANIVMPLATNGENVVLSHSGWGDGSYPVVLTREEQAALAAHHEALWAGCATSTRPRPSSLRRRVAPSWILARASLSGTGGGGRQARLHPHRLRRAGARHPADRLPRRRQPEPGRAAPGGRGARPLRGGRHRDR